MSNTPLSDMITAHSANGSSETWAQFLEGFRQAQLGVIAIGLPAGATGKHSSSAGQALSVGLTLHASGRPMALAFADPIAFAARFGQPFNATMFGNALLKTMLHNPECAGVLVNSAVAEVSVVIDRTTAETMVRHDREGDR